jgi:hypothetical protein
MMSKKLPTWPIPKEQGGAELSFWGEIQSSTVFEPSFVVGCWVHCKCSKIQRGNVDGFGLVLRSTFGSADVGSFCCHQNCLAVLVLMALELGTDGDWTRHHLRGLSDV